MNRNLCKKGMVLGIVIIFIGMGIVPTTATFQEDIIEVNNGVEVTNTRNNNYYNSLGEMNAIWNIGSIAPAMYIYPVPLHTNYYFPEQNGNLIANFSVNCTTYALNSAIIIPRCSFFKVVVHNGPNWWHRIIDEKIMWIRAVGIYTPDFCMVLENISIPMNGQNSRTLYVELLCGGHPFNPLVIEFPFFAKYSSALVVVRPEIRDI